MIFNEGKHNAHWRTCKLHELGTFARGKSRHRPRNDARLFENGKYPLVQTGDVKDANLYITNHSAEYGDFGLQQSKLWNAGILCITIAANIAETAILKYPMCFPDSVVGFTAYPEKTSELFMHYVFTFIRESIQNSVTGSIQDNINIEYLTNLNFKTPCKDEQDHIAFLLSSLDKKIDCNNRINAELEAMAKTLYDYWFVQFDFPNKDGKPYKSSGGKMQYNEELKRDIPEGWEVKSLGSLGNFKNGINYSKDEVGDKTYKIVNVRDISSSSFTLQSFDCDSISLLQKNAKNYLITENSILIARSGIPGATRLIIGDISDTIYCGFIICFNPSDTKLKNYIFFNLKTQELTSKNSSAGTILKNISQDTLKDKNFFVPCFDTVEAFNNRFEPIVKKMCQIQQENQELAKMRDWLLPMLMNGQVSVGDV